MNIKPYKSLWGYEVTRSSRKIWFLSLVTFAITNT